MYEKERDTQCPKETRVKTLIVRQGERQMTQHDKDDSHSPKEI